jgi:2-methylisocitrate lyase-like PEP mutase family enzyme
MSISVFRKLHTGPAPLMLPNAWDAGTARLIESLGAKAIATTSAGLAWSRGYPDGNALPNDQLIAAARDIARCIRVARLAVGILDVGAVGINIEDGANSPDLLCRKIEAIRESAARSGLDLFINARTDVYLRRLASKDAAVDEVIGRAARYRTAGCDGLFVPGLSDGGAMARIAAAIKPLPLNIMASPDLPSIEALQQYGVRRVSAGSAIAQAALGCTSRLAAGFLAGITSEMFGAVLEYGAINELLVKSARD